MAGRWRLRARRCRRPRSRVPSDVPAIMPLPSGVGQRCMTPPFQIVDDGFPGLAFVAAAQDRRHGAFFAQPEIGPAAGGADVEDAVLIFGDGDAVVMIFRRNIFPMAGAIGAAKAGFAAGEKNHAAVLLGGEDLVDVHVGEPFVAGLPAAAAVVAQHHAADFDAGVEAILIFRLEGEIARARLQFRTRRKIGAGAVQAHAFQVPPSRRSCCGTPPMGSCRP